MEIGAYSLAVVLSYLIGSLPSGYLAGKARGMDIRLAGSGNIGATNVFRVLGKPLGIAVLLMDGFKGFAAARWVPLLAIRFFPGASKENLALVAGAGAVLGHIYTCWLKFKGGKGIATSAGVGLAWAPAACLTAMAVWGIVFLATRYVSVASLAAAVVLPIAVWCWGGSSTMTYLMTGLALLAIVKHKGNIERLLRGTESRASAKKGPRPR